MHFLMMGSFSTLLTQSVKSSQSVKFATLDKIGGYLLAQQLTRLSTPAKADQYG